ncbi:hypothetical protein CTA1_11191 [Colletotrichum tanaceti]|uniref:Uncharacterized protein n=1 Tax=Colletotrichum tanaceti TaxID=1306861 RepID=A0A4U6WYI9_9PEZI|nr:hypothetical protein CTA1_11191 [Colletotrichum tanaceti]
MGAAWYGTGAALFRGPLPSPRFWFQLQRAERVESLLSQNACERRLGGEQSGAVRAEKQLKWVG